MIPATTNDSRKQIVLDIKESKILSLLNIYVKYIAEDQTLLNFANIELLSKACSLI